MWPGNHRKKWSRFIVQDVGGIVGARCYLLPIASEHRPKTSTRVVGGNRSKETVLSLLENLEKDLRMVVRTLFPWPLL